MDFPASRYPQPCSRNLCVTFAGFSGSAAFPPQRSPAAHRVPALPACIQPLIAPPQCARTAAVPQINPGSPFLMHFSCYGTPNLPKTAGTPLAKQGQSFSLYECLNPTAGSLDNGVPCSRQQPRAADGCALMIRVCDVPTDKQRERRWRDVFCGASRSSGSAPPPRRASRPDGRLPLLPGFERCPRRLRQCAALITQVPADKENL